VASASAARSSSQSMQTLPTIMTTSPKSAGREMLRAGSRVRQGVKKSLTRWLLTVAGRALNFLTSMQAPRWRKSASHPPSDVGEVIPPPLVLGDHAAGLAIECDSDHAPADPAAR
jgi:hypothetical protein